MMNCHSQMPAQIMAVGLRECIYVPVGAWDGLLSPGNQNTKHVEMGSVDLWLLCRRKINTPIAPELGLFLDESIFSSYNARWGEERGECISLDGFREQVANFKVRRVKGSKPTWLCFLRVLAIPHIWLHCQYARLCASHTDASP